MAKRQKRVKLSKAQILENDSNKWQAKKTAAIDMLCKAVEHLKAIDRRQRGLLKRAEREAGEKKLVAAVDRTLKKAMHPVQRKIADKLNKATQPTPQAGLDVTLTPEQRDQRMEAMGFRKTKRTRSPVV